jgi:adenylate cyclase
LYQNHLILAAPLILFSVILSALYTGIFRFLKERKQNEYIKNLFSRYVHKDVLQELLNSSSQVRLGGERREVSVLFSDLRGFTTFSEQMNAEELTTLLNDYLSAMSPIILEEKGTIDKYIGDAIMAFWNAPLPTKDHAKRAAKSALRMQEALNAFNKERNTTLAMGIGIHSGEVIVGNVGSLERINYTILGDVVNNTSRLEGITKKYGVGIIATEELKQKIDDPDILFRKLDVIIVKGKTKPTHIFEVLFFSKEKESLVHEYEEAFLLYQKGDFNKAKISFEKLEKVGDAPSAVMLERIAFLEKNTSKEWDGVWKFNEK